MKTLRIKLFSAPCLVKLPFELVIAGAPGTPVFAMNRSTYDSLLKEIASMPNRAGKRAEENVPVTSEHRKPEFVTQAAQVAAADLSVYLSPDHYKLLSQQAGVTAAHLYRTAV